MAALATPRRIILLVPAGKPVDGALASLGDVLDAGDVVMDGGNEWFENTVCIEGVILVYETAAFQRLHNLL